MVTRRPASGATRWWSWPWHALLVGAYPVIFLFAQNLADTIVLDPLWAPLLLCVAGAAGLLVLFYALRRDWARAGLMTTALLAMFFSFGHVMNLVGDALTAVWLLTAVWVIWGLALILLAWRGGAWVPRVTVLLNLVAAALVLFNAVMIGAFQLERRAFATASGEMPEVQVGPLGRPDVYYIVLDRYAGESTLERYYGFDNSPFLDALEERGFSVAHDSWANYFKTALSVFSTMTMEHLDPAHWDTGDPDTYGPIHAAFQARMSVPATFKELGYEYVHIANWWEPTAYNVDADVVYRYTQETELSTVLYDTTLMSALLPRAAGTAEEQIHGAELQRRHVLMGFDSLHAAARRTGPTFTFAHLTIPHPPYAFNPDGSMPTDAQRQARSAEEEYIAQLQYANRRVLEVVDDITDVGPGEPDPIVILQTDEGPFPPRFAVPNSDDFPWLEATDDEIAWKFAVLTAYRLPGVDDQAQGFTDRTSPVNAFRIVFNAYFDAGLELLPDVTYLSPDADHMFDLVEYDRSQVSLPEVPNLP